MSLAAATIVLWLIIVREITIVVQMVILLWFFRLLSLSFSISLPILTNLFPTFTFVFHNTNQSSPAFPYCHFHSQYFTLPTTFFSSLLRYIVITFSRDRGAASNGGYPRDDEIISRFWRLLTDNHWTSSAGWRSCTINRFTTRRLQIDK